MKASYLKKEVASEQVEQVILVLKDELVDKKSPSNSQLFMTITINGQETKIPQSHDSPLVAESRVDQDWFKVACNQGATFTIIGDNYSPISYPQISEALKKTNPNASTMVIIYTHGNSYGYKNDRCTTGLVFTGTKEDRYNLAPIDPILKMCGKYFTKPVAFFLHNCYSGAVVLSDYIQLLPAGSSILTTSPDNSHAVVSKAISGQMDNYLKVFAEDKSEKLSLSSLLAEMLKNDYCTTPLFFINPSNAQFMSVTNHENPYKRSDHVHKKIGRSLDGHIEYSSEKTITYEEIKGKKFFSEIAGLSIESEKSVDIESSEHFLFCEKELLEKFPDLIGCIGYEDGLSSDDFSE